MLCQSDSVNADQQRSKPFDCSNREKGIIYRQHIERIRLATKEGGWEPVFIFALVFIILLTRTQLKHRVRNFRETNLRAIC